jgi:ubiquinone/menaquinone biosynthesis C-methylase UbiE
VVDDVPQFDKVATDEARDERRTYWDEGWKNRVQTDHSHLTKLNSRAQWEAFLAGAVAEYDAERFPLAREAGREAVRGKVVLDIGCGSGRSGATFAYYGAHYIGIDHSSHAAGYQRRWLNAAQWDGLAIQGNADSLPLRSNSIDVVYSCGVLHHTPRFQTAMDEAYRVLKPGGTAVIALYATYSTQFGVMRLLGMLRGHLTREAQERWMSEESEGDWRTGQRLNPWTETFSKAQLRAVVRKYDVENVVLRKNGHPIGEFPRYGVRLMRSAFVRAVDRMLEPLLGGMLVLSYRKRLTAA